MKWDLASFQSGIEAAKGDMIAKSEEMINSLADTFIMHTQDNLVANGSIVTGNLYQSIDKDVQQQGDGIWTAIVGPAIANFMDTVQYGIFVEDGRGEVRPVTKKALHWVVNGKDVYAKYSRAAPPKPFMAPALTMTEEDVEGIMTLIFEQ